MFCSQSLVVLLPPRRQLTGRLRCLDLTARLSGFLSKSTANAGTCQELRWTKPRMMACSSVTEHTPTGSATSLVPCRDHVQAQQRLSQLGHQGETPLFIAAQEGHHQVIQQLIAAGPVGMDLKTSRPKVGHTVRVSRPPRERRGVFGCAPMDALLETVCWMHFHAGTPPDISTTVPSDVALGPGARC